jgi:protein-S-isoprenylcysteine O-methyltransferase Ste14
MPVSAYVQTVVFFILMAVTLFGSTGTTDIPVFWVYLAIFGAVFIASFAILDPGLIRERMRPGGQKPPRALWLFSLVLFVHWVIAGLDRGHYHWSDAIPLWLQIAGLVALTVGFGLCLWAMRVNRFFSSVIRIQNDRGQTVISTGPYGVVRHPGYTAGIVIIAASGVALGSWAAAAVVVVTCLPFLLYRAITEDRVLQANLPGYADYTQRVRWRLVPGIW